MYSNCLYGEPYEENSTGCHIVDERNERIELLEREVNSFKQALNEIKEYCNENIQICKNEQSTDEWECCIEELQGVLKIINNVLGKEKIGAKEMFEKLDFDYYEKDDRTKGKIIYYLKAIHIPNRLNTEYIQFKKITFALNGFEIENWLTDAYINKIEDIDNIFITFEELQAINKQIEELGWKYVKDKR